jgi:hypothetical protein
MTFFFYCTPSLMAIELDVGEIVVSKDDANRLLPLQLSRLFSDRQELFQSLLRCHCLEHSINYNGGVNIIYTSAANGFNIGSFRHCRLFCISTRGELICSTNFTQKLRRNLNGFFFRNKFMPRTTESLVELRHNSVVRRRYLQL